LATLVERNLIFKFLPQNAREALPVIVLFLFIIPAVILFMYTENKLQKFKFIEEGKLKSHRFKNILNSELPSVTQKQNIPIITVSAFAYSPSSFCLFLESLSLSPLSEYLSCF